MENPQFNIEQFRTKLTKLRENFGHNSYITYGSEASLDSNKQKEEDAKRKYEEILNLCVEALQQADDKDAIVNLINREFIGYYYPNEISLFDPAEKIDFWRDIALKLAKKASAPAEASRQQPQATAETPETTAQTAAITATVGAAAQEAVQETGRDFLKAFREASQNNPLLSRENFMQVGDYIKASRAYAENRFRLKIAEGKDPDEIVNVRVAKIISKGAIKEIEVELDGQKSIVDGSLFYNIGKPFGH